MPKSRFNAVRERARATRHNPIGRKNEERTEGSEEKTSSTTLTPKTDDALPILKSLPLDDHSQSVDPSEILWALTSLTGFLSDKTSRTQLLAPQHSLISRVLLQLKSENQVQLRDAASGCLRNLCIEAGGKVRKVLEAKGCVELCIKEVQMTAGDLGLIDGPSRGAKAGQESTSKKASSAANRTKEGMNRKEKRLAAKAEAAAAKRKDTTMDDGTTNAEEKEMREKATDEGSDDEEFLLCCSHLNNLVAILWCLAEVSPHTVDLCHRSATTLSQIFSLTIGKALQSVNTLSQASISVDSNGRSGEETESNRVDVGKKDQIDKARAMVQVALTCSNALVTLTDSDPDFSAAFVGVSKQELRSSMKGKKKSMVLEDEDSTDGSRQDGLENLAALSRAVVGLGMLPEEGEEGEDKAGLRRQATSLALLSMAALRNIQSCLPGMIRDRLQVPVQQKGQVDVTMMTIGSMEVQVGLDCLTGILTGASSSQVETRLQGLQSPANGSEGQVEQSKKERQAEEELNNLNLALEILAELAGDREGWSMQTGKAGQPTEQEESIAIDEEGDEEEMDLEGGDGDGSNLSLDPEDEEMFLDDAGRDMDGIDFSAARIVAFFSPPLVDSLLLLSVKSQAGFADAKESPASAALRSISIRALSVLNNQFLVLASFAQPPPSQPARGEEVIKSFHRWLQSPSVAEQMAKIWRWQFEYASRVAALPLFSNAEDVSEEAQDGRKVVEIALCIMWSLSRSYEGVQDEGPKGKVIIVDASAFTVDDFCITAQSSLGVVDSLMAAYKGSKRGPRTMLPPSEASEANASVQLSPSPDGIRIHSLGILSTLLRRRIVSMESKADILTLLADTLDVLATSAGLTARLNSKQLGDSTSMDAMVVAVNAIIDTFADETSEWDAAYTQLRLQSRLKRASVDVRSATRSIDKRRQPTLRGAADEAWSNLVGFLQYRDSLSTGATAV